MGWAAQGEGSCSVLGIPGSAGPIHARVFAECRERAHRIAKEKPTNRVAAAVIVVVWLSLAALAIFLTMCAIWTLGWR